MTGHPDAAYKILTAPQLADLLAHGSFAGSPADLADGFIHLSAAVQVAGTLERHFAGQDDLALAAINLAVLGDAVRWEAARGGDLFPHVYAPLLLAAVFAHGPLRRDDGGAVILPG